MNSPYEGKFKITQTFKGATHDGLDLVGIDSKEIHATAPTAPTQWSLCWCRTCRSNRGAAAVPAA